MADFFRVSRNEAGHSAFERLSPSESVMVLALAIICCLPLSVVVARAVSKILALL